MIKSIHFKNFRKFSDFSINLRSGNILVGPNNAGKSAIIDSIRILASCLNYSLRHRPEYKRITEFLYLNYYEIPDSSIPISLENITRNYIDEDAEITISHENGARAFIYLHPMRSTRFGVDAEGTRFSTGKQVNSSFPLHFIIVPTIMPLLSNEPYVTDETLRKNEGQKLASRNFRNIWVRKSEEEFEQLKNDTAFAWSGIELLKPTVADGKLTMFYKENRLDREIQWSGFGFQVWLQIMTHLLRAKSDSIIIIDEPDIYLHPDLQKKLMKTLRDRHKQYLVATHSVEIINDADGQEIVSINPDKNRGYRLRTTEDFDEIYGYIGAADNADYARIAKVKRVVFFEGNDKKTYLRFARRLNFNGLATGGIPFVKLGGFSQWTRAESAVWAFKEVMGIDITVFAVFDRDYRSDGEIEEFENSINSEAGTFRVLSVKEVENFLLNPDAICLAINKKEGATVSLEWVKDEIMKCTEELKHKVMSQRLACALEYHKGKNSGKSDATLLEEVSEDFESSWENFNKRMVILPGKISLNKFNAALAKHDIRGLTETQIVSEFRKGSIPDSLSQVLTELDDFCSTI